MKEIKGDLIKFAQEGKFDVIVHGCNSFCRMGSGIAPQMKNAFPGVWLADSETKAGDIKKLGSYTSVNAPYFNELTGLTGTVMCIAEN